MTDPLGAAPSVEELATAPLVTSWEVFKVKFAILEPGVSARIDYRIQGYFIDHPYLDPRELSVSSRVLQLDPERQWARCESRIYRLGNAKGEPVAF